MYSWSKKTFEVKDLIGKTFAKVYRANDDEVRFVTEEGDLYAFYHYQDCCETVVIKDIVGDLEDLIGHPILEAEESVSDTPPDGGQNYDDSNTWTFYKFGTIKGHVNISWHGSSNGYYSESVDKVFIPSEDEGEK